MTIEFIKYLSFLFLMYGECRGEPLLGQYYVATVAFERNMEVLNYKQFNAFLPKDIEKFKKAYNGNKKYQKIIINDLFNKLTIEQFYYWTLLYLNKSIIKAINFDRRYYYMTVKAFNACKKKYPKWTKKLSKIDTIGNHMFLADKNK